MHHKQFLCKLEEKCEPYKNRFFTNHTHFPLNNKLEIKIEKKKSGNNKTSKNLNNNEKSRKVVNIFFLSKILKKL